MKVRLLHQRLLAWLLLGLLAAQTSCKNDSEEIIPTGPPGAAEYNQQVPTAWYKLQLRLIRKSPGFSPPVAARALGYTGVALYESVVPGMPNHKSLATVLQINPVLPLTEAGATYHWPSSANAALAKITRQLFAHTTDANKASIDSLENLLNAQLQTQTDAAAFERSSTFGQTVAERIFTWSSTDGGHEGYLTNFPGSYTPPTGPGMWVPTSAQGALQPYWGNNRPFMPANITGTQMPAPMPFSNQQNSAFHNQALEVYHTSQNLTPDQQAIALFWADNAGTTFTPGGHSTAILLQFIQEKNLNLAASAEALARMGIALNDAFICCWKAKYTYNLIRPISYIKAEIDPNWSPLLGTPPFPEYSSGHSTQTAAAAALLAHLFGNNTAFTDYSHQGTSLSARSFSSFSQMADEASISRLYGGIHYRQALENGVADGTRIGQNVANLNLLR